MIKYRVLPGSLLILKGIASPFFSVHRETITFGIFLPKELKCTINFEKYQ